MADKQTITIPSARVVGEFAFDAFVAIMAGAFITKLLTTDAQPLSQQLFPLGIGIAVGYATWKFMRSFLTFGKDK